MRAYTTVAVVALSTTACSGSDSTSSPAEEAAAGTSSNPAGGTSGAGAAGEGSAGEGSSASGGVGGAPSSGGSGGQAPAGAGGTAGSAAGGASGAGNAGAGGASGSSSGGTSGSGGNGGTGGSATAAPLLERNGCFTISTPGDIETHAFGTVGKEYPNLFIRFRLKSGPWRFDVFDRDVLNHNLFGLFRNDNQNFRRYLLGLGAQVKPPLSSLNPQALFFSRLELGQGYTTYKTLKKSFGWDNDQDYDVVVELDAASSAQRLSLARVGSATTLTIEGDLEYLDPTLTSSGFKIELGAPETDHRDVSPAGWSICDLEVATE